MRAKAQSLFGYEDKANAGMGWGMFRGIVDLAILGQENDPEFVGGQH